MIFSKVYDMFAEKILTTNENSISSLSNIYLYTIFKD